MYTSPPRQLLVLDSKFRTNPEDKDHSYKFKLNGRIRFDGMIRLEQFIFQNSQYVFSSEKRLINSYTLKKGKENQKIPL